MKYRINEKLENHTITNHSDKNLYVLDYKHYKHHYQKEKFEGKVVILNSPQVDWKSVHLANPYEIEVNFDGFEENSLPQDEAGKQNRQCECVLFSECDDDNHWVLFIETKYTSSSVNAFKKEHDYPRCMINQIIETVQFFRDKEIIPKGKRVSAIVSFPMLAEDFNSYFLQNYKIDEILLTHKIILRAKNSALIRSKKRIII
jgi:hypothetical protein